jgi:hypothetical protein
MCGSEVIELACISAMLRLFLNSFLSFDMKAHTVLFQYKQDSVGRIGERSHYAIRLQSPLNAVAGVPGHPKWIALREEFRNA